MNVTTTPAHHGSIPVGSSSPAPTIHTPTGEDDARSSRWGGGGALHKCAGCPAQTTGRWCRDCEPVIDRNGRKYNRWGQLMESPRSNSGAEHTALFTIKENAR